MKQWILRVRGAPVGWIHPMGRRTAVLAGSLIAAVSAIIWADLRHGGMPEADAAPPARRETGRPPAVSGTGEGFLQRMTGGRPTGSGGMWDLGGAVADPELATLERRKAAFALGAIGSADAFRLLWAAFDGAPLELQAAILEATGQFQMAAAEAVLRDYARGENQVLARASLRGLASLQPTSIVSDFAAIMDDPGLPISLRTEAALCLGELDNPASTRVLIDALPETMSAGGEAEALAECILEALASRPERQIRDAFAALLESPGLEPALRATVLESMGQIGGDVSDLVLPHLGSGEAAVREAAAWALASSPEPGRHVDEVLNALRNEGSSVVRAALYGAAGNQDDFPAEALISLVGGESDSHARAEGLRAIAGVMGPAPPPHIEQWFDETGVSLAKRIALDGNTERHDRMLAVMALVRAGTGESRQALEEIASSADDSPSVKQAATTALGAPR